MINNPKWASSTCRNDPCHKVSLTTIQISFWLLLWWLPYAIVMRAIVSLLLGRQFPTHDQAWLWSKGLLWTITRRSPKTTLIVMYPWTGVYNKLTLVATFTYQYCQVPGKLGHPLQILSSHSTCGIYRFFPHLLKWKIYIKLLPKHERKDGFFPNYE